MWLGTSFCFLVFVYDVFREEMDRYNYIHIIIG
jgi:hypothetical protein